MSAARWRSALAAGAAVVVVLAGLGFGTATSQAASVTGTETFHYTGQPQPVTVPGGFDLAVVRVVGGKGGSTYAGPKQVTGGDGAEVTGRLPVSPGQVLTVKVGGYGGNGDGDSSPGEGGWGATGRGGRGGLSSQHDGAGGGGASGIELGGQNVVVAGGGGGAGGAGNILILYTGGPGGSSGETVDPGHDGTGPGAGRGGAGAGNGQGSGGVGGNSSVNAGAGGGGGSGLIGGGGGGVASNSGSGPGGGGGGAGSSLVSSLELGRVVRGQTADGNGVISITWEHAVAPDCPNQQADVDHDSQGTAYQLRCSGAGSFRVELAPGHGRVESFDQRSGTLRYVPDRGFSGVDTASFTASAGAAQTTFMVDFVVARECFDQTVHVPAGSPGVGVQLHCTPANEPGEFRFTTLADHGHLRDRDLRQGTFTYVPLAGYAGTDTVGFESVNRGYASKQATVTFVVGTGPVIACPDQEFRYVQPHGKFVQLSCPELAAHPAYRIVAVPEHGRLEHLDLARGTFTYFPDSGYLGLDSVIFQAVHGDQVSAQATVRFMVTNPQAPMDLSASATRLIWHDPRDDTAALTVRLPANATGIVGFYNSDHQGLGTADIVGGTAQLTVHASALGLGSHLIHASYLGNEHWAANDSNQVQITVTRQPVASMQLTASATQIPLDGSVVLAVHLPTSATGHVGFYDANHRGLGIADIARGIAHLVVAADALGLGTHLLHASYGGNQYWSANDSNQVQVTVHAPMTRGD